MNTIARRSVYNVCTGVQTTLAGLVDDVRQLLSIAAEPERGTMPARSWDTDVWVGDPSALARDTGWRASTGLSAGLERTLQRLGESPRRLEFYGGIS